ncbi:hypothetical protein PLEOSDRAFT_1087800 [Pleurotus ostreatus PC15]|uniref:Uncharacterized protein n=1 Tax=Pleurotus ostreatus (strain PC15) TaxID=1137138 RepID=A0A067PAH0_PLEO1|nr:hypothetical protein PLEOSDRAFT_1087800 [Pleurotus ostreatus PC15]
MFEDVCLLCGKHLLDDGRAYCSDECQSLDSVSPSISSASSAVSSPYLSGNPLCGDIPALVPSALGSAFGDYPHYSASSSASTTWSVAADEDDFAGIKLDGEYLHKGDPRLGDGPSKSATYFPAFVRTSVMTYARRPSGTNQHANVPILHRRTSSVSTTEHMQGAPRSAPLHSRSNGSSTDEEDYSSDIQYTTADSPSLAPASKGWKRNKDPDSKSTLTKPKRNRNRASLPACFSLLHINGETRPSVSSPRTAARPSPPTPKLPLSSLTTTAIRMTPEVPPTAHTFTTPRGRRREPRTSRSSRRSEASLSRSASRSRSRNLSHPRVDSKGSVTQVFDLSSMLVPRGRTAARRNSSPPSKMVLPVPSDGQCRSSEPFATSRARSGRSDSRRSRGRARLEELDGNGSTEAAPGYGYGRSGLIDRERTFIHRTVAEYC